jgi:hypothetical protein
MNCLPKSLDRLRQEAKSLGRQEDISHRTSLEAIARHYGFPNWKSVLEAYDESRAAMIPTPPFSINFVNDSDVSLDAEDKKITERSGELQPEIKIRIARNKAYFASLGVEFSMFEPTKTGLKKMILDATRPVRHHFESEKFHCYDQQEQGPKDYRVAYFVSNDSITKSKVSLYRPVTKKGDPRMWFSRLADFANAGDQVAIVVFESALYLFNFSDISFDSLISESDATKLLSSYVRSKSSIADELLVLLKEIAKNPIKSPVVGDTAVGMAVELALGIPANSDKRPDYKGIELKSGRGKKTRATLFAQVADWSISQCKSSAEILDAYGYQRPPDFKLYCTVSTQKPNSQGLCFFYDESLDQVIEKNASGQAVAIWPGSLLRGRLLEKHAETFWIQATSTKVDGVEYFKLISVTHTKRPLESQLLPLIQSGVITMDHLIKRKGGSKPTVSEKGPLFKINKRDLSFLFPEPKVYSLNVQA